MADYTLFLNISITVLLIVSLLSVISINSSSRLMKYASVVFYFIAVVSLGAALILRWKQAGHPPLSNTYETLILFAFITLCAWIFLMKNGASGILRAALAVAALLMTAGSSLISEAPRPLVPALKSNWLTVHVLFSFISYSAFAVSFVSGIITLVSKDEKKAGFDSVSYKAVLTGFPFLTLGIITGAVWAERAWGAYWSWDPKETWALITWFVYAAYLHLRVAKAWQGTKAAWVAVIGFCFVLFTYFGVNYLLGGLHSYK